MALPTIIYAGDITQREQFSCHNSRQCIDFYPTHDISLSQLIFRLPLSILQNYLRN